MLQILSTPRLSPRSQMLQKNIRAPIKENQETLYEFGGDSSSSLLWSDIPGPADICEAAGPTTKSQNSVPEEHAAFDPVRQAAEYCSSHLFQISLVHFQSIGRRDS